MNSNNSSIFRPRRVLSRPIVPIDAGQLGTYLTTFSTDEINLSRQMWKRYASRKQMADRDSPYSCTRLQFYHNTRSGKRKLPYTSVKLDLIRYAQGVRKEQREFAQGLLNESLTGQEWYEQTLFTAKITHYAALIVSEGGYADLENLSIRDRWLVTVIPAFLNLNLVATQLSTGSRELNGRMLVQADGIAEHIVESFENFRLNWALGNGIKQAKRLLQASEGCRNSGDRKGCVELAARGWQPIWQIIPIGGAACYHKCRCIIVYREDLED